MRVRCVALKPNAEQVSKLRSYYEQGSTDYDLVLGCHYLVLGIGRRQGITWVELPTPGGWILTVPLFLFEITDARASRYWVIEDVEINDALWFGPALLFDRTLNARLADGEPAAVERYQRVLDLLNAESEQIPLSRTE